MRRRVYNLAGSGLTGHRWAFGRWAFGWLLLALLLAAGCEMQQVDELSGSVRPACSDDGDCPAGDECAPEIGACVAAQPTTLRLAAHLTPPPTAGYATTQFVDLTAETGAPVDFTLPTPRRVRGWVRAEDNLLEANVPATITARAPGQIPDTEFSFTVTSKKTTDAATDYGYELLLAPTDEYYQLTVLLGNDEFPPYHPEPRKFGRESERLDLVVPSLEAYHRIAGRVVSNVAAATPVARLRVSAFSLGTPNVSTVAEVDEDGYFVLSVPPTDPKGESYSLVVEPTGREDAIPASTLVEELFVDGDVDAGDLALGALPGRVAAHFQVMTSAGVPAEDVRVRCEGEIAEGTLTDEQATDADGSAELVLRKGSYECTCAPASGASDGAGVWTLKTGDEDRVEWTITLERKVRVTGVVRDHSLTYPLADVTVVAVHVDLSDPRHGLEVETTTDADGRYILHLEPQTYALVLLPPEGSLQPVRILEDVIVGADTELDIAVESSTLVSGTVRGASGEPLAGVQVAFYRIPPDADLDGGGEPQTPSAAFRRDRVHTPSYDRLVRVVGSTMTDDEGAYRVLLPVQ